MDDLEKKLDQLFSSPDGMKKIEELMTAFGGSIPEESAKEPPTAPLPTASLPDLSAFVKLMPLLDDLQKEDDSAALLKALRPHLQEGRQKRLDEAGQMLKIMRFMPLIKELGKGEEHGGS